VCALVDMDTMGVEIIGEKGIMQIGAEGQSVVVCTNRDQGPRSIVRTHLNGSPGLISMSLSISSAASSRHHT
jgi:hypothetical protein